MPKGLNENYARELMELHTLGVDGGYTQKDVQEVARALTGWTIDRPQQGGGFVFRPQMHDTGEKTILGYHFPAGDGEDEGERVLDILAKHPRRRITSRTSWRSASSPTSRRRRSSIAPRRCSSTRTATCARSCASIVTSPEFFAEDAYRAKVKTPLEFVVSAVRATGATVVNAQPLVAELRANLGMPLYGCQPPTGYSMTADAWVNTGALLEPHELRAAARQRSARTRPSRRARTPRRCRCAATAAPEPARRAAGRGGAGLGRGSRCRSTSLTLAPDTSDASRDASHRRAARRPGVRRDDEDARAAPRRRSSSSRSRSARRSSSAVRSTFHFGDALMMTRRVFLKNGSAGAGQPRLRARVHRADGARPPRRARRCSSRSSSAAPSTA